VGALRGQPRWLAPAPPARDERERVSKKGKTGHALAKADGRLVGADGLAGRLIGDDGQLEREGAERVERERLGERVRSVELGREEDGAGRRGVDEGDGRGEIEGVDGLAEEEAGGGGGGEDESERADHRGASEVVEEERDGDGHR
jgi:hypothetical protein